MNKGFFKNKVVVITGSRMGIGKELARQLAVSGAKVVLNARTADSLKDTENYFLSQGFGIISVCADVSIPEDCKRLIDETVIHYGKIDIIILNAGLSGFGNIEDSEPFVYKKIIETNLLGPVYLSKFALPYIKASKGSIIFISSLAGINGIPGYSAYSSSKMGLTSIAESLRMEAKGIGIHIGIAYVGFTVNDKNKKVYDPSGAFIYLPERKNVKVMPVEKTARKIIHQIKKRKFKDVHTLLGKMNWFIYKLFPGLIFFIISRSVSKFKS